MNFIFCNRRMEKINGEKTIAVKDATYAAVAGKKKAEKFMLAGIRTLTSALPV